MDFDFEALPDVDLSDILSNDIQENSVAPKNETGEKLRDGLGKTARSVLTNAF